MPKRWRICVKCGKQFDAEDERCEYDPTSRRYTCQACLEAREQRIAQRKADIAYAKEHGEPLNPLPGYYEARDLVISAGEASTSLLCGEMNVSYTEALNLLDQLWQSGVIGEYTAQGKREVLIQAEHTFNSQLDDEEDIVPVTEPVDAIPEPHKTKRKIKKQTIAYLAAVIMISGIFFLAKLSKKADSNNALFLRNEPSVTAAQVVDQFNQDYADLGLSMAYRNDTFQVYMQSPGMTQVVRTAIAGDATVAERWETTVKPDCEGTFEMVRLLLSSKGYSSKSLIFYLLDDEDNTQALMRITADGVQFDAVEAYWKATG